MKQEEERLIAKDVNREYYPPPWEARRALIISLSSCTGMTATAGTPSGPPISALPHSPVSQSLERSVIEKES